MAYYEATHGFSLAKEHAQRRASSLHFQQTREERLAQTINERVIILGSQFMLPRIVQFMLLILLKGISPIPCPRS